jgi:electron transfer flavoprotein alpha subunit
VNRLAVVPVRAGELCAGGAEAVAESCGSALLVGDGTAAAVASLAGLVSQPVLTWEVATFAPGRWAAALAPTVEPFDVVIIPNCPDGRDLAPRLADQLGRVLLAGAIEVGPTAVTCTRWGSLVLEVHQVEGPIVATLQPGVRGVVGSTCSSELKVKPLSLSVEVSVEVSDGLADAEVLEVLPPDVTTMDLAEAPRILAGGAGLGDAAEFAVLGRVAAALGASVGATRVVTDAGLVGHERQIGTTGVAVQPRLYVAFGISGAVQHTSGLGDPEHIVSVNTDPHCPMMAMADMAIVTDAPAALRALASRLGLSDE